MTGAGVAGAGCSGVTAGAAGISCAGLLDCGAADWPLLATDEDGAEGGVGSGAAEASAGGFAGLLATSLLAGTLLAVEAGAELSGTGTEP